MFRRVIFGVLFIAIVGCEDVINIKPIDNSPDAELIKHEERLPDKRSAELLNNEHVLDPLASHVGHLVGQQVEITNHVAVPIIKYRNIPVPVPVPVSHPIPVPVHIPISVPHPVPVPVHHNIPVPVEKPVPVFVPKPYPVKIVKKVPVPVPEPFPVPVYKTRHIHHIVHAHPKHHHQHNDWW